tara:strand:- start:511 stop:834 length:324 start_codon:yes stop_codon:yes gene_type:complete
MAKRKFYYYQVLTGDDIHAGYLALGSKLAPELTPPVEGSYFKQTTRKAIEIHKKRLEEDLQNVKFALGASKRKARKGDNSKDEASLSAARMRRGKGLCTNQSTGGFF